MVADRQNSGMFENFKDKNIRFSTLFGQDIASIISAN